ncbi:unnamed protein product [Ostreobium quekettii]|uniref:Pseudouridine synthase RsuA/RluA-like domain-containing protein n=1 Tax=Ostreobium quekettii TaxID=121088 RepID=A0A8S1J3X8_9CHLO|nr:unnamed protein product [Ostreobium quekettii]|eukprot:evm.model.scf_592.5 EVM.evm.TU.scf_592.5   scf_592:25276-26435(-)
MALAKTANAATWLCEAFIGSAAQSCMYNACKVYWAVVVAGPELQNRGWIRAPVKVEGVDVSAETHYEVKAVAHGLAWVQLKPVTGRKHQLRQHCAFNLNSPVLGDRRYGRTTESLPAKMLPRVKKLMAPSSNKHMIHLHAHELTLTICGGQPVRAVAPIPRHMKVVFDSMAWRVPEG